MWIWILVALAVVVVGFIVAVALRPSEFRIERGIVVAAPPAASFGQVNDLHRWQEFSPWAKMDPTAKITYDGPPAGAGASFSWDGNNKVGQGRMTITDSRTNELVRFKLEFHKPFTATNVAEFTFKPQGDQTAVTWSMTGRQKFMVKAMCMLFMDMDKMVGGEFEKGLATLKSIAESSKRA